MTETVIFDLTSGRRRALDVEAVQPGQPTVGIAWSPDGSELAYGVGQISDHGPLLATNLLTQQTRTITGVGGFPTSWKADGLILYDRYTEGSETELAHREVWSVTTDGGEPSPFVESDRWLSHGQRSADGRWISYSVRDYERILYVVPWP